MKTGAGIAADTCSFVFSRCIHDDHPTIACAATKRKSVRRGVKEVVKAVRKTPASVLKAGSLCVIAGNISPIDVIAHLPVLCEDNGVPYCYVRSKEVRACARGVTQHSAHFVVVITIVFLRPGNLCRSG